MLLTWSMKLARAKGAELLCVETSPDLVPAINLYKKAGFQQYGDLPGYWNPDLSLLILARKLTDIHVPVEYWQDCHDL
jgi:ribosomal protein S18 acetylase RimI-like enzyme